MTLRRIEVSHFRCVESARLDFDPGCNVIYGENASGKTSLLEAIFFLGSGRSFRSAKLDYLIQRNSDAFVAVGHVDVEGRETVLGVRGSTAGLEARVAGQPAKSLAEMAALLPVQVIDPEVHKLVEDGPSRRRRFMDWGVFHVEHGFVAAWRRYQRSLQQRNAALKLRQSSDRIRVWDRELVQFGSQVAALRGRYLEELQPFVEEFGLRLLQLKIELAHQQGWRGELSFETALAEAWARDQQIGVTSVGPHRADIVLRVDGMGARDRISRGQQKLLACALMLAQQAHRAATGFRRACLLLDDPAAELDVDNLGKLLVEVARIPAQLIVTSLHPEALQDHLSGRLFHVERGKVTSVL